MDYKKLLEEIQGLSDKLARLTDTFNRTFEMGLGIEITETRRLLINKSDELRLKEITEKQSKTKNII